MKANIPREEREKVCVCVLSEYRISKFQPLHKETNNLETHTSHVNE